TLRAGTESLLRTPLLPPVLFSGLRSHWQLLKQHADIPPEIAARELPSPTADLAECCAWVLETLAMPAIQSISAYTAPSPNQSAWWLSETRARLRAIAALLTNYLPWLLPEFGPLREILDLQLNELLAPPLKNAADLVANLEDRLSHTSTNSQLHNTLMEKLRVQLPAARERLSDLATRVRSIAAEAFTKAEAMDFAFLVQKQRQLLSIGYEVNPGKLHEAAYDMLASEARIATFIAVARGDLSQQSWFKMGRAHTSAFGCFILLSWTGTMFEYLMPSLWMRSYPDTLIARSLNSAVAIQRRFAGRFGIPWGISESGYGKTDEAGHYHYQAFGIPQISLKWDADAGPVISPYSTFLALGIDPASALRNLHRMDKAGWIGAYGFYEAADFSESRKKPVLVREWMAHHQGMALLAILNLLQD